MKISKNNYSPNDRFLIKIFTKIISLDSSQRVPPMSPCPPLIITTVCPWLINHLSDPWDCNNSNGILLRSNWRKPYPKFYGSSFYGSGCVYLGVVKKTSQKVPTYLPGGGGVINPVLALNVIICEKHLGDLGFKMGCIQNKFAMKNEGAGDEPLDLGQENSTSEKSNIPMDFLSQICLHLKIVREFCHWFFGSFRLVILLPAMKKWGISCGSEILGCRKSPGMKRQNPTGSPVHNDHPYCSIFGKLHEVTLRHWSNGSTNLAVFLKTGEVMAKPTQPPFRGWSWEVPSPFFFRWLKIGDDQNNWLTQMNLVNG